MANIFTAAEIIDLGIAKEKKRRDFYGYAADKFHNKDMKDLFSMLRDWEEEHIKKFTGIRDSSQTYEVSESYQDEFGSYIKFAVDDLLYKQVSPEWFAKNVLDELTAIQYGIGFEKDAILFFSELLEYMGGPDKEKVEILIGEEKKHLIYLSELKKKYRFIKEIRAMALIIGVELSIKGDDIYKEALKEGLLINCTQDTVLRIMPPMTVKRAEIDKAIAILDRVFSRVN